MSSFLEMAMEFINSATQVLRRQESTYEKVFDGGREIEISSDSGKISDSASDHYVQTRNARWISYRAKAISLHLSFLSVYLVIAVVVALIFQSSFNRNASLIHSPATSILKTRRHTYNGTGSYYVNQPSPENDERWKSLILGNFVKLSPEDLKKVGREKDAVYLEDGSGIGLINAHHEVHCVMSLYHYSHPEYYWPNASTERLKENRHHQDHCLDYLLQAAMCHGDVGYMTYHWDMEQPKPFWKPAEHTCVNWDVLRQWMRERTVPIHKPGFLVHPSFGPAYPNGVQSIPTIHNEQ